MHPDVGKRLAGKYEIVSLAGAGGMAEVFRGITHGAEGFQRPVAIKRILEALCDNPQFVGMFVEEARVVSELQHPNIVQIHDFDRDSDGTYFLIMEWVEGLTLFDWCRAHRDFGQHAPWHLVTAMGIEVLKALSAAHEREDAQGMLAPVFHRDVTPQNIMLNINGTVKLADFGLARAMDRARMTQPHVLKGKLTYLAPELVMGGAPSAQSDIFGVGIVLWEALAGRKLFDGDGPLEILDRVREANVPDLTEFRPDAPSHLHAAVHKALRREPNGRFSSAKTMVRALANILRMTPESTSADVLRKSVLEARQRLRARQFEEEATQVLDVDDLENDLVEEALLLTRKKH